MNPPSSTPQDEATTSTTIENPMSHIPKHDVTVFAPCACGWVPERLKEFMHDQHNQRRLTMDAFVMETEEQGATSMSSMPTYQDPDDSTYAPPPVQEDMDRSTSSQYTERYDCLNFALVCDRLASALGTALLQDFKIKDKHGKPLIMDKSKVRREKEKCRQEVLRKRLDDTNLLAFSFDGRKDDTLTIDKIDEKYHTRMVKEPHLVILREPNSELIGYVRLEHETAEYKTTKLNGFFNDKNISLDALIGICTDGEPTNTGPHGGIIRRFELLLKRPLHWFVCLLHFNELPFRHLFEALDKSTSTGPRSATGKLSRQIETCETLPVVDGFQKIELQNMPPAPEKIEFSTDSKYLYDMAHAISSGVVPVDLANIKPGKIVHSRWLTKAARLLRLYVTTENPDANLRILVEFIIKCYVPMYFNIKYYSSVVYGSALFFKFIGWSRFLEPRLRKIVNQVIKDNSYYAHSENILLSMLFDDSKEKRDCAIKKILRYRTDVDEPMELRVYKKPDINFNCTSYTEMINLNDINIVFEPPFTRSIPYDTLKEYLNQDDPPFNDPKIPSHIQGTERHVQLLASVSKRVIPENVEAVMATTLESRAKLPRLERELSIKELLVFGNGNCRC
ncbi:PREDICTED: uncharacterized protein LOC108374482 [Rhagoletis zephyria]|uniref:uncharacterized protein LOC108374482 n=1 Tax=Rhagoletis zephyria TaxID=28612 RepID=UPI0008119C67|nr:PREDICTED: uncharacterized protein LOC108374482 [Rhagoletis zephyria]